MFYKIIAFAAVLATTSAPFTMAQTAPPPSICVLVDFSASIAYYGVSIPTVSDIKPLLDLIGRLGGEVAFGTIQENPSTPLLRLRIPPPERGLEPPAKTKTSNVFSRAKLLKKYRRELPEQESREKQRRENNKPLIEAFSKRLEIFLAQLADAQMSDVWGNTNRCQTFLLEPSASENHEPNRHLILISDGQHNVESSAYKPIDRSISVASVSGIAGGDTAKIGRRTRWYESVSGAVIYVITNAERRR